MTCNAYKDSTGYDGICDNCGRSRITHDRAAIEAGKISQVAAQPAQCIGPMLDKPLDPREWQIPIAPGIIFQLKTANDTQVGGDHYKQMSRSGQQHWDMAWDFKLDFFQYQVTKYLFRWRDKHGVQDLEKAKHFLEKYIEVARQYGTERGITKTDLQPNVGSPTVEPNGGYVNQGGDRQAVPRG